MERLMELAERVMNDKAYFSGFSSLFFFLSLGSLEDLLLFFFFFVSRAAKIFLVGRLMTFPDGVQGLPSQAECLLVLHQSCNAS